MEIPQTLMKKSQTFMKNSQKHSPLMFFPHFLSMKKKYGSFQESTFLRGGQDPRYENSKNEDGLIN